MPEQYAVFAANIHDLLLMCLEGRWTRRTVSRFLPPGYVETSPYFQAVRTHSIADMSRTRLWSSAVAAVFIGASANAQYGADTLTAPSPAETRGLASLLAGLPLPLLGISPDTAKKHLVRIFQKTSSPAKPTWCVSAWGCPCPRDRRFDGAAFDHLAR
jgi:hypothetical protein